MGTAINLICQNLPRVSVDIDLLYLPKMSIAFPSLNFTEARTFVFIAPDSTIASYALPCFHARQIIQFLKSEYPYSYASHKGRRLDRWQ